MMDFTGINGIIPQHVEVLDEALRIAGYATVSLQSLSIIQSDPETTDATKNAIRAVAFHIEKLNSNNPNGSFILHKLQTIRWSEIGLSDEETPALDDNKRGAIIGIVLGVSQAIISGEMSRLNALATFDTSLPPDWNTPPEEPEE